jgi:hypothetical protein
MYQSFDAVRSFIQGELSSAQAGEDVVTPTGDSTMTAPVPSVSTRHVGLTYNINIVLPESENIAVFNAIFRSLNENLLK